ncbi:MAG: biotin-dependent carboxyltransferase family protein [Jatrophihabitans sp.]|uniref:5-oxoprolinase subunit C family protein n=1 Tax=Jatrophihabitans sp. TaxID=1932789 RepID=UPI003F7F0FA1
MIEIVAPGPLATVQDLGRVGLAALGVPRSGAFDRAALRLANRLVGNDEAAAAIEFTLGGLVVRCLDAATVALTGARCPGVTRWGEAVTCRAGTTLRFGVPATGLRSYLAVRGGIAVEPVLGSRSTDRLSGLGPPPLAAGALLSVGAAPAGPVADGFAVPAARPASLAVVPGPRNDWFTPAAVDACFATSWTVTAEADRIGIRLDGPHLERAVAGELPSEPMRPGSVQVPPSGHPLIFGPDAPVTGGYPVLAVLLDPAGPAQLRPGDPVRFAEAAGRLR